MWRKFLNKIVTGIKNGKYPFEDTSLAALEQQYNYYHDEMIHHEENMTIASAERVWEQLEIFQNFICDLYPEYKQRIEEENRQREEKMQRDIENGVIKVIHF